MPVSQSAWTGSESPHSTSRAGRVVTPGTANRNIPNDLASTSRSSTSRRCPRKSSAAVSVWRWTIRHRSDAIDNVLGEGLPW